MGSIRKSLLASQRKNSTKILPGFQSWWGFKDALQLLLEEGGLSGLKNASFRAQPIFPHLLIVVNYWTWGLTYGRELVCVCWLKKWIFKKKHLRLEKTSFSLRKGSVVILRLRMLERSAWPRVASKDTRWYPLWLWLSPSANHVTEAS